MKYLLHHKFMGFYLKPGKEYVYSNEVEDALEFDDIATVQYTISKEIAGRVESRNFEQYRIFIVIQ